MDEAAVVTYSERVLDGAVPHRDFLTFNGLGNLWIVAGAFAAFGETVATERAVGLLYRIMIVLSLLVLGARTAGLFAGVLAGSLAAAPMSHELVWANPLDAPLPLAGTASGVAGLIRFDFAAVVVLSALPRLPCVGRTNRLAFAADSLP